MFRREFIFYFFLGVVFCAVTYMFFVSALRQKVEDYFYDVRVRMQTATYHPENIALVTIDDDTIDYFEGEAASDLSGDSMVKIINQVRQSDAREIVALYLSNIFSYSSSATQELVELTKLDDRVTIGALGLSFKNPFFLDFPAPLEQIADRVRGIDTFKSRSTRIVRQMPYHGYRGGNELKLLPAYLAQKINGPTSQQSSHYIVNYLRPEQFDEVPAESIASHLASGFSFKDKIVIIGYKIYRKWPAQTLDPLLVNTPFQGSPDTYLNGMPLIYLTATSVDNLVNQRALAETPVWFNVLQVIVVTLLFAIAWRLGPIAGSITTIVLFAVTLQIHALAFEYLCIRPPFAETFIFSSFAVILGVIQALHKEIQKYGDIRAKVKADQDLDKLQSRFLDRFAQGVSKLNRDLLSDCRQLSNLSELNTTERKLVDACVESSIEFEEFLDGIKQLASTSGDNKLTTPTLTTFALRSLVERITNRFAQQIAAKEMVVKNLVDAELAVNSSYEILDTILYNLISNAIKYSPASSLIEISAEAHNGKTRIQVSDNGPGIPPNLQKRIFEKFYRVKDDNVYRIKGTGIGLYLTRFFAEKIGAQIGLSSTPGEGSRFYLDIKR